MSLVQNPKKPGYHLIWSIMAFKGENTEGTVVEKLRARMRATVITKKSDIAKQNVPDSTYPTLEC